MDSPEVDMEEALRELQRSRRRGDRSSGVSTGWVVFSITHDEPERLTALLKISPDRIIPPNPETKQPGYWQLHSALAGAATIEEHFQDILKRLVPCYRTLWKMSSECPPQFSCSLRKDPDAQVNLQLSARTLLLIGYIGGSIEFDIRPNRDS